MRPPLPYFVFIVDQFPNPVVMKPDETLHAHGLVLDGTYHIADPDDAERVLREHPEWLNAEQLLVFMSTFAGDVRPSVVLAERIKRENPQAQIIFRSTCPKDGADKPIFSRCIDKDERVAGRDSELVLGKIVREFLAAAA